MRVFLMGMPGSGKSSLGKRLAYKLKLRHFDLDSLIVKARHLSIAEIFASEGEDSFRRMERDQLKALIENEHNCVVSLGGGTPAFFDNLQTIKESGISIYLQMNPAALAQRILKGKGERPMFRGLSSDEVKKKLSNLLTEREKFYSAADIVVDGMDVDVDRLVTILLEHTKR